MTKTQVRGKIARYERGMKMSIECMNHLDENLKEKLKVVRQNILTMTNIPYEGVKSSFETPEEQVTIYSLLPNLEGSEIIERTTEKEKSIYIMNNGLMANIKKETLEELQNNIAALSHQIARGSFNEITSLNVLPQELENIVITMNRISTMDRANRIDLLYQKYCLTLKELRRIQIMSLDFEFDNQKLRK